jgi:hypothetical protein
VSNVKRPERWQSLLRSSQNVEQIIALMREYLSLWTRGELVSLREDCQPRATELSRAYIEKMAIHLARCDLLPPAPQIADSLHSMALVFVQASSRIAQVAPDVSVSHTR